MAERKSTCVTCNQEVTPIITKLGKVSKTARKHCSKKCQKQASISRLKAAGKYRHGWGNKPRLTVKRHCLQCGAEFDSYSSTGAQGGWTRHCSAKCGSITSAMKRNAKRGVPAIDLARRIAALVKAEVVSLYRIGRHFMARKPGAGGPKIFRGHCAQCGTEIIKKRSGGKRMCGDCVEANAYKLRKKHKRIGKAKRRAITRGARADSIDPIKVFDRDRWSCQLCGKKTPRPARGTYADNAPELDHIISLAEGGDHTWTNVQCACRRCNLIKGSKSQGQMHMFAA